MPATLEFGERAAEVARGKDMDSSRAGREWPYKTSEELELQPKRKKTQRSLNQGNDVILFMIWIVELWREKVEQNQRQEVAATWTRKMVMRVESRQSPTDLLRFRFWASASKDVQLGDNPP